MTSRRKLLHKRVGENWYRYWYGYGYGLKQCLYKLEKTVYNAANILRHCNMRCGHFYQICKHFFFIKIFSDLDRAKMQNIRNFEPSDAFIKYFIFSWKSLESIKQTGKNVVNQKKILLHFFPNMIKKL